MNNTSGAVELNLLFGEAHTNLKYVVYVLKKSQLADQENYTDFYGGADVLPSFDHKHILWGGSTIGGVVIPNSNSQSGSTFNTTVNVSYGNLNPSEMEIVVMVLNGSGSVLNVMKGNANESVDYDYL